MYLAGVDREERYVAVELFLPHLIAKLVRELREELIFQFWEGSLAASLQPACASDSRRVQREQRQTPQVLAQQSLQLLLCLDDGFEELRLELRLRFEKLLGIERCAMVILERMALLKLPKD
jgi:hypothetical protein